MNDKIRCICGAVYPDYMIYNTCQKCKRNLQSAAPINDNQISKLKNELENKTNRIKELEDELTIRNSSIDSFTYK